MVSKNNKAEFDFSSKTFKEMAEMLKIVTARFAVLAKESQIYRDALKEINDLSASLKKVQSFNLGGKHAALGKKLEAAIKQIEKNAEWHKRLTDSYQKKTKLAEAEDLLAKGRLTLGSQLRKDEEEEHARNMLIKQGEGHKVRLLEEAGKTERETGRLKKEQFRTLQKMMGVAGGGGMFEGLENMMGFGVGVGMQKLTGIGNKISAKPEQGGFGISERILKYQEEASGRGTNKMAIGGTPLNKLGKILNKVSPRLQKAVVGGKKGGGMLGMLGKGTGKAGGMAGLLAGGAAGLLGGIVMKGLESSPMFKAMSKIVGQAFSLYLRPIGDLVGGIFKPLMIPMMKMAAANARKGAELIKSGEVIGKGLVALVMNPAGFFNATITQLVDNIHQMMSELFLPIVRWFNPQAVAHIAKDSLGIFIETTFTKWKNDIDAEFGAITGSVDETTSVISGIITGQETTAKILDKILTEAEIQTQVAEKSLEILIPKSKILEHPTRWVDTWTKNPNVVITDMYNSQHISDLIDDGADLVYGSSVGFAAAIDDGAATIAKTAEVVEEKVAMIFEDLTAARMTAQFGLGGSEWRTPEWDTSGLSSYDQALIIDYANKTVRKADTPKEILAAAHALDYSMGSSNSGEGGEGGGTGYAGTGGTSNVSAAHAAAFSTSEMAEGGIINEQILGIGASGRRYMFGEKGSEVVTPIGKSNTSVNVVINIAKMTSDVDLQQIKPIIERAILETHARRGII